MVVAKDAIDGRLRGVIVHRASSSADNCGDVNDAKEYASSDPCRDNVGVAGVGLATTAMRPPSTTDLDASAALIARSAAASARAVC